MATLGDPLADLGLLVVYWDGLGASDDPVVAAIGPGGRAATGRPSSSRGTRRAAGRDRRGAAAGTWRSGYFKIAVILEGIHYRYVQGQTVGDGLRPHRRGRARPASPTASPRSRGRWRYASPRLGRGTRPRRRSRTSRRARGTPAHMHFAVSPALSCLGRALAADPQAPLDFAWRTIVFRARRRASSEQSASMRGAGGLQARKVRTRRKGGYAAKCMMAATCMITRSEAGGAARHGSAPGAGVEGSRG